MKSIVDIIKILFFNLYELKVFIFVYHYELMVFVISECSSED